MDALSPPPDGQPSPTLAAAAGPRFADIPPGATAVVLEGWAAFDAEGSEAREFLQGQLSSDVKALAVGEGQYASYNSPKGRMLATLVVWRREPERFTLVLAADLAEGFAKRLAMFVLRAKVRFSALRTPLAGVAGAQAWSAVGVTAPWRSGWNGVALALPDGRVLVDAPAPPAPMATLPAAEATLWDWLGVRAGVPVVTAATREAIIAQSANWELVGGVDFGKGCYPGQEIIARMQYLGRLKERLHGFHADAPLSTLAAGTPVEAQGHDAAVGVVVNATPAPGGGIDLLAVVRHDALEAPLSAAGATLAPRALPYAVTAIENVRVRL